MRLPICSAAIPAAAAIMMLAAPAAFASTVTKQAGPAAAAFAARSGYLVPRASNTASADGPDSILWD
jgi:hypothetical protein